jgi:rhodanese-related sulfurtransferase
LIIVTGVGLLIVIALVALNTGNKSSTNSNTAQNVTLSPVAGNTVPPNWTATTVAFDTVTAPSVLPRITLADAKALYDSGSAKIIDVREANIYTQGHIKGAINIPEANIGTHLADVPKTGTVILYCDCPHDEESAGTAYSLKTAGYTDMKVLQGPMAYTLWKNAGYPIETGTQ